MAALDPHINPDSGVWDDNFYAQNNPSSGGGSSSASYNTQAYDDLYKNLPKATDFAGKINTGINDTFSEYANQVKNTPGSLDFYTKNLEAAGIPSLQKTASTLQNQVYSLEDTLRKVEGNVDATTKNSVVTQGQRAGMIEARQQPLIENLGWVGQSLGRVTDAISQGKSNVLTLTGLNQQDSQRVLDVYKEKLSLAVTQGAQSLQAFIKDSDSLLNVTLAKIQRGEQLDDQETQNAFELLKMQKTAEVAAKQPNNQLIDLGGRKVLIDANTGKEIAGYNEVKAPSAGGSYLSSYSQPTSTKPSTNPYSSAGNASSNPQLYNLLFGK